MTIAMCFLSMAIVLTKQSGRSDQERFLALFLFIYGLVKFDQLYMHTNSFEIWPHLAGIMFSLKLFLPSVMYFYTRSLTEQKEQWFKRQDTFALCAPFIAALVATPYYVLSAEQKVALMNPLTRDPVLYERAVLGCQIGLVLFVVTAFTYLGMSFKLFRAHTSRLRMLFSQIEDKQISWLRWVIIVITLAWIWYAICELWLLTGKQPGSVYLTNMVIEMFFVGFIALRGINQQPVYQESNAELDWVETASNSDKESVYSKSSLTEEARVEIAKKLLYVMDVEQLYKDSELSLRTLSDKIQVSEVRISETFSQHMKTSFFDFVNQHRVREACRLLQQTDHKIVAVAFDAGFNSRSTFGAAFKKYIKQSPSQYRKQHSANAASRGG
ncbi:hypothetical protein N483_00925 [Pseudoalteromonas luteoviolacea NCIMB 1944]|nr:hypothetical protein N483_00925 [Pseudoalteromonas luteoviolacea NCIMB 1944]